MSNQQTYCINGYENSMPELNKFTNLIPLKYYAKTDSVR